MYICYTVEESEAERVMVTFGYGTSLPTTSKRRLQQSVQLARRILHLERTNVALRDQIDKQDKDNDKLSEEV